MVAAGAERRILLSQYLCGLATVTSCSRMIFAFARDGGLPASGALRRVHHKFRVPWPQSGPARFSASVHDLHAGVQHRGLGVRHLPLYLLRPAGDPRLLRLGKKMDNDGALEHGREELQTGRRCWCSCR